MHESSVIRLDLRAPLEYAAAPALAPFAWGETAAPRFGAPPEQLFCFAINPAQGSSIEPKPELFLGALLFAGEASAPPPDAAPRTPVQLPASVYLFTQRREALRREECIRLAIEQQKDGLWERHTLQDKLYVRYLFEDGKPVTQLFRPCETNARIRT
jgi:hypothetical protein